MQRTRVDLPEPLSPMMTNNSPWATSKLTSCTAGISPSARSRLTAIAKRAGGVLSQIQDPLEQRRRDALLEDYARLLRELAR